MKISILQHVAPLPSSNTPIPVQRNLNSQLHPLSRARERKRALNASKMERMFAKPFIAAFEGHEDSVCCLERIRGRVGIISSAGFDGQILVHSLSRRKVIQNIHGAHRGKVSGLCMAQGDRMLSASHDRSIKLWRLKLPNMDDGDDALSIEDEVPLDGMDISEEKLPAVEKAGSPLMVYPGKVPFNSIHHHRHMPLFVTASNSVHVWDETKNAPITNLTFVGSSETVDVVRFNMAEASVLASIGSDRTMCLYDIRTGKAERRVMMQMRSNALSWSPTQPSVVLLASEDHNLYTFDIRTLTTPTQIYKGHVSAVTTCDWSPTGTEFVSGGWDRTVRIWKEGDGRGKEGDMYHTKRMQRVLSTSYTFDARFIVSASDEGVVRLWKANSHDRLGVMDTRERNALEYREALKQRWKYDTEVARVLRSRPTPKAIKNAAKLKRTMLNAAAEKEDRRRKHSRDGETNPKAERRKLVVNIAENLDSAMTTAGEEAAIIAQEFVVSLDNVPSEVQFLLAEMRERECRIGELQSRIQPRSAQYLRHAGKGILTEKDQQTFERINADFELINRLSDEKVELAKKLRDTLTKHSNRLHVELAKITNPGGQAALTTYSTPSQSVASYPGTSAATSITASAPSTQTEALVYSGGGRAPINGAASSLKTDASITLAATSITTASAAPLPIVLEPASNGPSAASSPSGAPASKRRKLNSTQSTVTAQRAASPAVAAGVTPRPSAPRSTATSNNLVPSASVVPETPVSSRPRRAASANVSPAPNPSVSRNMSESTSTITTTGGDDKDEDMVDGRSTSGEGDNEGDVDGDDGPYCVCQEKSYGEMIGCDNGSDCPYQWFHVACVHVQKPLPNTWFCDYCTKKLGFADNTGAPASGSERPARKRRR